MCVPDCLVPAQLLWFPAVCCLGAWVRLVSVTSLRSIWELMTAHTERERGLVTRLARATTIDSGNLVTWKILLSDVFIEPLSIQFYSITFSRYQIIVVYMYVHTYVLLNKKKLNKTTLTKPESSTWEILILTKTS